MTEAVLDDLADASRLFAHVAPRPLATVPVTALARGERRARPRARARRDRVPRSELPHARARSDGRRAHDVRAGEFRALPAQDLQCRRGSSTASRRTKSLFAMIRETHRAHPAGTVVAYSDNAAVMEGDDGCALPSARRRQVRRGARAHAHAHEGRDAQSSDRDRAVPGRCDRIGRRDPRRRRHRHRRQAEGGPRRLHRVEPAHSGSHACVGAGLRQAGSHRVRAVDHDRRPDRRGVVQQRVRPAQPHRLLPHVRAGGRGRGARLSQADHDRRRRRQHPRRPHAQARARRRRAVHPAWRARHADRHGRRRRIVDGDRREHRGPRLRLGAARQCGDRAARAGGDRPLLAARRAAIRSCRSTTSARADCPTRCPSSRTAAASAARSSCATIPSEEPGMSPREIWCNEAQERYVLAIAPILAARIPCDLRARALSVRRDRHGQRAQRRSWWRIRNSAIGPSTSRSTSSSASRRR